MMHPITIPMIFISGQQATAPVGNSSYQAGKPVALSVRVIVQLENEIICLLDIPHLQRTRTDPRTDYGCGLGIDNNTPKALLNLHSFIEIDTVILHTGKIYFFSYILRVCNQVT